MNRDRIVEVVEPVLKQFALDLDAVEIKPAGKRSVVRVVVDGDGPDGSGPSLDDIAEATTAVSGALDASDATGAGPYTLEVTSRGVTRPLTLPRHWRRNTGRLVAVTLADGAAVTGRIAGSDDDTVTLEVAGGPREVAYSQISKALIQVELNRPRRTDPAGREN
ncbi:ribosome maturation factor RimP [Microlunatus sp. Gsoil 973]|jgi:ribosome maturation factor RimP|uniref:ribosome maturation factor RimP n=1 Tax=Microlunatus sp. Gsoil 973 TaxID=2672569 RepID=UPI0012B45BFD|nr:ribosome maturation factor RimP [Microlunatus sp. Gsoil 973]QGN32036.1 ribosome maturation factor RimP [Microlunatus sp. Gsoil 973]